MPLTLSDMAGIPVKSITLIIIKKWDNILTVDLH